MKEQHIFKGEDFEVICGRCRTIAKVHWFERSWSSLEHDAHVSCHGHHRLVRLPLVVTHDVGERGGEPALPLRFGLEQLQDLVTDDGLRDQLAHTTDQVKRMLRYQESLKMVMRSRCGEPVE